MREAQKRKKELDHLAPKSFLKPVAPVLVKKAAAAPEPSIPEFTWGLPLPRRTKTQLRAKRVWNRRKKEGITANVPKCQCGECGACHRRIAHSQKVRKWRANKQVAAQE